MARGTGEIQTESGLTKMGAIQEEKVILRARMRGAKAFDSEQYTAGFGVMIGQCKGWERAGRILLYAPLPSEPNNTEVFRLAREQGKETYLPRYVPGPGRYEAALVKSQEADLTLGQFGILEPGIHCPSLPLNQLDFALVPGLAFDATGRRLGRGRGFYDRLLTEVTGIKCGIAFDHQMVEQVPIEPHDVVLNCILTPTRWIECPSIRTL